MNDSKIIWVRYTWDLQHLNVNIEETPADYILRSIQPLELRIAIEVVLSAYRSDPVWEPLMASIEERMTERILTTFGTQDSDYLAAEFGGDLVAISGITKSHWTDQNLLTGICVLPNHQQKGLGRCLLALSLWRLREMGLPKAIVYTESGSLADRKVYPLFNSTREENVEYPGLQRSQRS